MKIKYHLNFSKTRKFPFFTRQVLIMQLKCTLESKPQTRASISKREHDFIQCFGGFQGPKHLLGPGTGGWSYTTR